MKVVILCGGKGSRLASPKDNTPKPLVIINGKPMIWHIMKIYMHYGYNEFILPLGFGGDKIKEYFWNYEWKNRDFIKDTSKSTIKYLSTTDNWKITFVDTGIETMTGGRIMKIKKYIDEDIFMLTYGDGLSDVNIEKLLKFHNKMGKIATVTGIERKSQFGVLNLKDNLAISFDEKSKLEGVINGGYFVLNKEVFNYLKDDKECIFEQEPLKNIASDGELAVFMHKGYWQSVDTYKDLVSVNNSWKGVDDAKADGGVI
jgi:glucose-1-phosphate cytidylyltransferase